MKKDLTKRCGRNLQWYLTIVRNLNSRVVNTLELTKLFRDTDNQLGIGVGQDSYKPGKLRNELVSLLGEKNCEIVEDSSVKVRGRGKGYLFSLNLPENGVKGLESIMAENFYDIPELKTAYKEEVEEKIPEVKEEVKEEKVTTSTIEKPSTHGFRGRTFTPTGTKKLIERVWSICVAYKKSKLPLTMEEVAKITGTIVSPKIIGAWISALIRATGVYISYSWVSSGREKALEFSRITQTLISLSEKGREFGLELDYQSITNLKPLNEVKKNVELKESQKALAWYVCGLLKEANQAVDVHTLCKLLRENFNVEITSSELIELTRMLPEVILSNSGNTMVSLNTSENAWEDAISKYSPKRFTRCVLARISMTLEEVQNFLPNSEIVSKISDNEAIYKLVFDESQSSKLALAVLTMGFRGTDMLLDPEVASEQETVIKQLEKSLMRANPSFRIEKA